MIIGFAEKHRALEVLPQLQRLHFSWSGDLHNAATVEVEADGRLKLFQGLLLDTATCDIDILRWKDLLSTILSLPHGPRQEPTQTAGAPVLHAQTSSWLERISLDREFTRNAAAILRPDSSAVLAIVRQSDEAIYVMSGYSHFVLHTRIE